MTSSIVDISPAPNGCAKYDRSKPNVDALLYSDDLRSCVQRKHGVNSNTPKYSWSRFTSIALHAYGDYEIRFLLLPPVLPLSSLSYLSLSPHPGPISKSMLGS